MAVEGETRRQMKAMNGVEEKKRADAFVEIAALPSKGVEFGAGGHQFIQRRLAAMSVEGSIANGWIGGGNETGQALHIALVGRKTHRRIWGRQPASRFS